MKKQKGITLISLIITIIILIILAGISIHTLIGENGIITKAKEAKQNITLAGEAEALGLNQLYYELETKGELTEDEESIKKDEIINSLQNQIDELQAENEDLKKQILDGEDKFEVQIPVTVATGYTEKGYSSYVQYTHQEGIHVQVIKVDGNDGKFGSIPITENIYVDITNQLIAGNTYSITVSGSITYSTIVIKLSIPKSEKIEVELPMRCGSGYENYVYRGYVDYIHQEGIHVQIKKTSTLANGVFGSIAVSNSEYVDLTSQLTSGTRYRITCGTSGVTYTNMTLKLSFGDDIS